MILGGTKILNSVYRSFHMGRRLSNLSESESSEYVETRFDLKWICIVNLLTIFVWWFGYMTAGISYPQFYRILMAGFSAIFIFFNIFALTAATIFNSGFRNKIIRYASLIFFVLSMIFLFLVYALILFRLAGVV
jgi:hypothetical protein